MFSLFVKTEQSVELVSLLAGAAGRARTYDHDYIGVEHVMLGIRDLPEEHEVRQILNRLPIDVPTFWESLQKLAKVEITRTLPAKLPLTPRLHKVLELAKRQAKAERQRQITIWHFLLGVARENNSLVAFELRSHLAQKNPGRTSYDNAASRLVVMLDYPNHMTLEQHLGDLHKTNK